LKAAVYTRYGPPEIVQIVDVEKPVPKDNEVLIKVRAASVNPLDCGVVKGGARIVTGLRKPKVTRLGIDVAGQVEAVGRNVTQFKPGDEVFGLCIHNPQASGVKVWAPQGAFADYVCAPESTLALKPDNVTFEQAASAGVAALTALQGLRDKGNLQPGQKVLINGAAGGVGTFAAQIAKSFGAEVTGVCSTRNVEMVRSLGADRVIDYTEEDFTGGAQRYDLLFDCVTNHSPLACRRILTPYGRHVEAGGPHGHWLGSMARLLLALFMAFVLSRFMSRKLVIFLAKPKKEDLTTLQDLMKSGKVTPVIDRCYCLSELPEAICYLEKGHARGKVVLTFAHGRQTDV